MKLHLPKLLLTAVIAACAAQPAIAGWAADSGTGGHIYWYADNSTTELTAPTNSEGVANSYLVTAGDAYSNFFLVGEGDVTSTTLTKLSGGDGVSFTLTTNPWHPDKWFSSFSVGTLEYGAGAGSGSFNIEKAETSATISTVSGAVKVSNKGTLTIGVDASSSTTFCGTITNTGTMTVNGAVAVTNLSNFTIESAGTESWSDTANSQGFKVTSGATYVLSTGDVNYASGLTSVDDNGTLREVTIADGKATFQGGSVNGTTYYLINADATAGAAGTEGAKLYDVASGRTLYIVDGSADSAALTFAEGSTLNISNASRTFTSSNKAQNVIIGAGGIVTISGCDGGTAYIRGDIDVQAGGKLVLNAADSLGWESGAPASLDLIGAEGNLATAELHGKQTLSVNISLNGHTVMTNAGGGALEFLGGNINVSGTNNTIAGNLMARNAASISVADGGTLTVTGDLTCNTVHYPTPGSITKTGAGELILAGTNNAHGLIDVQSGSLVLNNGLTTAGSGSLSISEGASLTTGATIYHNGSGSVTLNGTIVIDTTDLTKFEMAAAGGEVTYSDGSDGFMTTSGATYYLVKGEATGSTTSSGEYVLSYGENGVTFADSSVTTSEEYFVNTAAAQSTDGTFKYKLNGADAVLNVNGTLSNSRIIMGEGKVAVSAGNTLNIDTAGDNAKALLLSTTGDGTIALGTNVTLTETEATSATGTLSIASGATLSIGAGDSKTASIASFSTVELDGGAIRFENKQDTFHNLTVTAKGGALHFEDMGQVVDSALTTLADTTTLNGDLKFTNKWNVQLQIEKLSGTGNFIIDGNGRNTANSGTISINGVDNYTGTVKITNLATNMKLSVAENLGLNVYVDSFVADVDTKNGLDLTGIGAGNTVTLQGVRGYLPEGGTIVADVVISNSADGSKAGLEINDGSSNSTSTFAGDVSGSGNLVINHALGNYTTKFTGDVSGWTGRLDVANGENNIVFTGDATKINNSEILMRSANKTANITFEHDNAVTVSSDFVRNDGSIDLTLNNSSEEGITFTGDRIAVTNLTLQSGTKASFTGVNALSVTDLTLAAGTKVSVGTGVAVAAEGAAPALAVTGAATLAGGSEVEGGLDLSSATSLTLNGMDSTVTITGDLTLPGTAISLSGDVLTALTGLTAGGKLDLFDVTGVFTLGDAAIASLTAEDNTLLNAVFSATEITEDYYLGYENGVVYAGKFDAVVPPTPVDPTVPEPTTATLSLLALAALAARRRRR